MSANMSIDQRRAVALGAALSYLKRHGAADIAILTIDDIDKALVDLYMQDKTLVVSTWYENMSSNQYRLLKRDFNKRKAASQP